MYLLISNAYQENWNTQENWYLWAKRAETVKGGTRPTETSEMGILTLLNNLVYSETYTPYMKIVTENWKL